MARKLKKVPQPPIDRANRPSERPPFAAGLTLTLFGLLLLASGLFSRHEAITAAGTTSLHQWQMVDYVTIGKIERDAATAGKATVFTTPRIQLIENPPNLCPT
jgi:hypothetical protein